MQAPTGSSGVHFVPKSVQSWGDAMPAMMSPHRHWATSFGGASVPQRRDVDVEAAPGVEVGPLVAQAQVAVRHVGDAAPPAADRTEDLPQHPLRGTVSLARHAAGEGVVHARPTARR